MLVKVVLFVECLIAILFSSNSIGLAQDAPGPNILLIVLDDMGFGDIKMSGNTIIRTPHLDALAAESINFSNFYVSPVCAPTRASLLTGKYHQRTGVRSVTNGYETLNPAEITLAEILSQAGYRTGLFGKWHLGEHYPSVPHAQGFEEYIGFRTGHTDNYFDAVLEHNGKPYPTKGYITDVLTDEAIHFMTTSVNKPFFCYLPFNAPHTPLDVPASYLKYYEGKGLPERVERIYAMVENIDDNIGRLLHFLSQQKLSENTIVVFMSDNGPLDVRRDPKTWRYNVGLRDQKFSVYEGGIRSRFFLRYPLLFSQHEVIETPAAHVDVLPTLLDLCHIAERGSTLDGISLVSALQQKPDQRLTDRYLYLNYSLETLENQNPYPGGIIRAGKFKMVDGKELYDLSVDPGEHNNLAAQDPEFLARLDSTYRAWWKGTIPIHGFEIMSIPVGYREEPEVVLAPHLGRVTGDLQYLGNRGLYREVTKVSRHPSGVDGDWVSHWTSREDTIKWRVNIVLPGYYALSTTLRGEVAHTPEVVVEIGDQILRQVIKPFATVEDWTTLESGKVWLTPGDYRLNVSIRNIGERDILELKNVIITF